jgi:hypothetical protein
MSASGITGLDRLPPRFGSSASVYCEENNSHADLRQSQVERSSRLRLIAPLLAPNSLCARAPRLFAALAAALVSGGSRDADPLAES